MHTGSIRAFLAVALKLPGLRIHPPGRLVYYANVVLSDSEPEAKASAGGTVAAPSLESTVAGLSVHTAASAAVSERDALKSYVLPVVLFFYARC